MFWLAEVPLVIGSLKPLPVTVSSKISLWPPKLKAPVLHKNAADFFYFLNRLLWVIFNLSLNRSTWNAASTDWGMLSLVALRRKSYQQKNKVNDVWTRIYFGLTTLQSVLKSKHHLRCFCSLGLMFLAPDSPSSRNHQQCKPVTLSLPRGSWQ